MKNLLLVYYHPVVFDLAKSFSNIFEKVEIAVSPNLVDSYGTHLDVISKGKAAGFETFLLNRAIIEIKNKKYDLVGLDGVFQNDNLVIDTCLKVGVGYFCIDGYPHNIDEPSENILSFSWALPEKQYRKEYPHEGYVKSVDWKNIAESGQSKGKNICVFYPEFSDLKWWLKKRKTGPKPKKDGFVSFIHRFEECNKESFDVFKKIQNSHLLVNYSSLSQEDVWEKMYDSAGLVHLKHADRPGIALIESMLLGRVPFVMKSFVLASQNQDLLIDGHSAIICDSIDELIRRMGDWIDGECGFFNDLGGSAQNHALMMTNFVRQRAKLVKFFERSMK